MPFGCVVPRCKSNRRKAPRASVFRFPVDDELKKKWIAAIARDDYTYNRNSRVCEFHFKESDFETEISAYDPKTDRTLTAPLLVKRLKKGAVPSLKIGSSNSNSVSMREDPEEKRMRLENEQLNLALQESLKGVSDETLQLENKSESNSSSGSLILRSSENKVSDSLKKKKRKSDDKIISRKKLNGIYQPYSLDQHHSNYIQSVSQSENLNGNNSDLSNSTSLPLQKVTVKVEKSWEKEYNFSRNSARNKSEENSNDMIKILNVESVSSHKNTEVISDEKKN